MKLGPAHVDLLERFVVAVERIAEAMAPTRAAPREMPDILKTPEPEAAEAPPPVAGFETCKCGHMQIFHAAGKGPCQRCQSEGACQKFCGTGRYAAEEEREAPRPITLTRKARKLLKLPNGDAPRLTRCARELLCTLAFRGMDLGATTSQLGVMTGYRQSGGFRNALSELRSAGFISGKDGFVTITQEGRAHVVATEGRPAPYPSGYALIAAWSHRLDKCSTAIVEHLYQQRPRALSDEEIAAATGYAVSGGFRNALSRLRTLELIEGRGDALQLGKRVRGWPMDRVRAAEAAS